MSWAAVVIGGAAVVGSVASAAMAPDAPDPYATADAQANANNQTARLETKLNRYDQSTPWGDLTWSQNEDDQDRWKSTVDLDPVSQQIIDASKQAQLQMANASNTSASQASNMVGQGINQPTGSLPNFSQSKSYYQNALTDPSSLVRPSMNTAGQTNSIFQRAVGRAGDVNATDFNYNNAPPMPEASDATRRAVEDALYSRATSRLDPMFNQRQAQMDSQLTNQGITQGSEAWNTEQQNLGMTRNDAYQAALNEAILAGGQEQSRQFDLGMQARQQGVGEADTLRAQPFNEANSLATLNTSAANAANNNLGLENAYQSSVLNLGNTDANAGWSDRGNLLSEQYTGRNQVLNELNALQTGSQIQSPQFQPTQVGASIAPTDVSGNVYNSYQGDLAKYNSRVNAVNSGLNGLASIGSAYFMG